MTEKKSSGDCESCGKEISWDIASISFDEGIFCSPDCAREYLETAGTEPDVMFLHDPQSRVPRDDFPNTSNDEVNIRYKLDKSTKADEVIDIFESAYPGNFPSDAFDD